jgi:hypothetical protein
MNETKIKSAYLIYDLQHHVYSVRYKTINDRSYNVRVKLNIHEGNMETICFHLTLAPYYHGSPKVFTCAKCMEEIREVSKSEISASPILTYAEHLERKYKNS